MADKTTPRSNPKKAQSRDDRLKAALKANLARRKAQTRARSTGEVDKTGKNEG
jgi:hypothetical protein